MKINKTGTTRDKEGRGCYLETVGVAADGWGMFGSMPRRDTHPPHNEILKTRLLHTMGAHTYMLAPLPPPSLHTLRKVWKRCRYGQPPTWRSHSSCAPHGSAMAKALSGGGPMDMPSHV
jgi:hypothetical protein